MAHAIPPVIKFRSEVLEAAISRVRALHVKWGIFEECDHENDDRPDVHEGREPTYAPGIGWTCMEPMQYVCRECHTDDGEATEDTIDGVWPCATIKALG